MQNPALSSFSNRYAGMGGYGGYNNYSSYGGGMGMNSYGGYGGMGSYNRFGGGMYGGMGGGMDPTFSSQIQSQTMPAFAVLESLVTAFSSLAQLFESTYAATHSSFFAMVGVAEQLGGIKAYLGQVLGLFSLVRLGKKIIGWLRGDRSSAAGGWAEEWRIGQALDGGGGPRRPVPGDKKPSRKPLILFLLSAVGIPYLMTKLVRLLTEVQKRRMQAEAAQQGIHPSPYAQGGNPASAPTQPLTFARTIWPFDATSSHELSLKRDEIVAVLQRLDAADASQNASWWRGRTRDGRSGWFPSNYVCLALYTSKRYADVVYSRSKFCAERKSRSWIRRRRIPRRAIRLPPSSRLRRRSSCIGLSWERCHIRVHLRM